MPERTRRARSDWTREALYSAEPSAERSVIPNRHRTIALFAAPILILPTAALAQIAGLPTPEEFDEREAAAKSAPLFLSDEPLVTTLRTDIEFLREERDDTLEIEGTATFVDLDGSEVTKPVDVRVRGKFRLDPRNCNFPPLRLDFPRSQMEGTVFEDQNRLKLVTPCHDSREEYQRYIYDEYLAYRILNLLTPYSHRVRLVEITYEDIEGDYDTRTKIGFLMESDEMMAERNRAVYLEDVPQMHPIMADGAQAAVAGMFNYMIGFVDWSPVRFHNVRLIRTEDGRHLTVPYDFDFSGFVNPRYSGVPEQLTGEIRNLRQRLYRGFCRDELTHEFIAPIFQAKRDAIEELYRSFPLFDDPDHVEDQLEWFEDFWEVIDDPEEFEAEILHKCREIPR